jgi:hypothetical protein
MPRPDRLLENPKSRDPVFPSAGNVSFRALTESKLHLFAGVCSDSSTVRPYEDRCYRDDDAVD